MNGTMLLVIALAVALGLPASAQSPTENRPEIGTATINPTGIPSSERNPLLTDAGAVRISKLVGTDIYNKNDKKVGSVDDVLAGKNGQLQVVIVTNEKRVAVPWDQVVFGDAKLNSDNKALMLDSTQEELNKMQTFSYRSKK
jgi:sporulation protein YlmC with PRC-barrel domain